MREKTGSRRKKVNLVGQFCEGITAEMRALFRGTVILNV